MPLAKPCFLYPIRGSGSKVLRVTSGATTEDLTFAMTANRNYWMSGDNQADSDGGVGGIGDLMAMLLAMLNTNSGGVTYTTALGVDDSLHGIVSVTPAGGGCSLLWGHANTTLDPTIFGFTAATYSTTAGVRMDSPNRGQGLWYPGRPPADDSRDRQPRMSGIAHALSGASRVSTLVSSPKKERDMRFDLIAQAKGLREYEAATDPYGSAEEFWLSGLSLGRPVRYYEDSTARVSTSYTLYRTRDPNDPIDRSGRYKLRWTADLKLRRVT